MYRELNSIVLIRYVIYKIKHLIELIKKNTVNVTGVKNELKVHKDYLRCRNKLTDNKSWLMLKIMHGSWVNGNSLSVINWGY